MVGQDTNMVGKRVRVSSAATSEVARRHAGRVGTVLYEHTTGVGTLHYGVEFEAGEEVMLKPEELEVLE